MTQLVITPKVSDKTARFKGTVAAGEHVAVTIKGGAEWLGEDDGANLTLRVLDLVTGRTLAVFPRPAETLEEDETPDAWSEATEDADDLYCELNLNTTRMVAAARHMLRVPVLFVLGDTDDPRTLYFRDRYEIEYWPERIGDTAPYDLDKWPKQIDEWSEQVAQFGEALAGHVGNAVAHVTATERATWNSKYAKPVSGIPANDLADGVRSAIVAVPNKADKATTYTKTEVDALVSGAASGVFVVADSLPATGEANKIYLVPNGSGAAGNVRDEYMWVNGAWELIGSTQVDLSDYYDKTAADGRFVQKETGKGLVAIDPTLTTQGAAADAKAVGGALAGKRDVLDLGVRGAVGASSWFVVNGTKLTVDDGSWVGGVYKIEPVLEVAGHYVLYVDNGETFDLVGEFELDANYSAVVQSYKIACCVDAFATVSQLPSVPSAYTSTPAMDGVGSAGSSGAWARGDHVHPTDTSRAAATDLPYAMVTPGEWECSDGENHAIVGPIYDGEKYYYYRFDDIVGSSQFFNTESDALAALSLTFDSDPEITATRPSLPGHLLDRAVNAVAVSTATELTLPALENACKARDFLVRLTISGSTVPTITFAAPTGETIVYETDGDEFPVPDAEGTWLYSFTETAAHTFAVSLKKVNAVAQGGS